MSKGIAWLPQLNATNTASPCFRGSSTLPRFLFLQIGRVGPCCSRKGVRTGVAEKIEILLAPKGLGFGPECALGLRVDRILKRLLYTNPGPPLFIRQKIEKYLGIKHGAVLNLLIKSH